MTGIVIQYRPYSEYFNDYVLIELCYPMRNFEEAYKMFIQEYPKAAEDSVTAYEFDTEKRPDLYRAFENSGCIRFFRTY